MQNLDIAEYFFFFSVCFPSPKNVKEFLDFFIQTLNNSQQGRIKSTSSVTFEVLIINCQTCSKDFFNFNCLISNYSFPKRLRRDCLLQAEENDYYGRASFSSVIKFNQENATCSRHNQVFRYLECLSFDLPGYRPFRQVQHEKVRKKEKL